jgi:hypothetical protein
MQEPTGAMQSDTDDFYKDLGGQAARRKDERKQRHLLSLGKYPIDAIIYALI